MKKWMMAVVLTTALGACDVLKQMPAGSTSGTGTGVSQEEASQGIKQALSQGLAKAILQLNRPDGFFGNEFYKILLPPDAKKIESALRTVGFGKQVDKAILQINRGAEDAVGFAQPIFVDAIKQMTLTDAINIVRGGDTSATHYFRTKTLERLTTAFMPVIKSSLNKVDATKYYGDIVNTYNSFPTTFNKVNPDLPAFVTERATNALFDLVAKEEKNIRQNPVARTTEILKKVFGGI